jgi:hypothetical protein
MISELMEFYSISLTVYKTVVITVYVPRDLTLNDTIILPEHPVYVALLKISENLLVITLILTLIPNFHRHHFTQSYSEQFTIQTLTRAE